MRHGAAPSDAERSARNLLHDPHGVFRTEQDWRSLITALGLTVRETGPLFGSDSPQSFFVTQPTVKLTDAEPAAPTANATVTRR